MKKLITLLLVISFSCTDATKELTNLWIHSYTVNCSPDSPEICLQIQESELIDPEAWQLLNDEIECFKYEEGFLYQIHVVKKTLPADEVHADGSTIKYSLVNIITKTEQNTAQLNGIWALTHMSGEEVDTTGLENLPSIEFVLNENVIIGTDGCNRINGTIKLIDNTRLEFMPIASTRMMCPGMDISDKFGVLIGETTSYKVEGSMLSLQGINNDDLIRFKKTN